MTVDAGAPTFEVATLDVVITVVYFVAVIGHGLWESRGQDSAFDYFLAGRRLPWYLIGLSLFASNMSGASFVGLMGASYEHGLAVFNYEWTATVVLVFFAFFMLPYFLRSDVYTIPEYLEERYDRRSRLAFSAFTVLAILFIDTAGALYAGGVVVTTVFDLTLRQAVGGLAALAGLYTVLGGLSAVVVTDATQAVLLTVGAAAMLAFGLEEVGGWGSLTARLGAMPGERLSLMRPPGSEFLPWTGIIGVILLGFYYWTLNQFVVQRTLGARDLDQGRKGALFAGLLKLPNLFLMVVPGALAVLLYPDLGNPDAVFPALAFDLLPVGFRGLVLTAIVAAIMSSLDSALNAASTLVTMDFVRELRPELSQEMLVRIGRGTTLLIVVFAALYSPTIRRFETLFGYFQSALSYVTPPIVAVYLAGIFSRRITARAAAWTTVGAVAVGGPLFVVKEVLGWWVAWGLPRVHYTLMGGMLFVAAVAFLYAVSLAVPEPDAGETRTRSPTPLALARSSTPSGQPWFRDARMQAAGLLVLTGVLVVLFW